MMCPLVSPVLVCLDYLLHFNNLSEFGIIGIISISYQSQICAKYNIRGRAVRGRMYVVCMYSTSK